MKCERCPAVRCRTKCDSASLRSHDAFDEMKSQTVTWHIRSNLPSSIERFKQLTLIRTVDARAMIHDAQTDFCGCRILNRNNLNESLVFAFSVLAGITQQIQNALRQGSAIGFYRRKIWIDLCGQFTMIRVDGRR